MKPEAESYRSARRRGRCLDDTDLITRLASAARRAGVSACATAAGDENCYCWFVQCRGIFETDIAVLFAAAKEEA